VVDAPAVMFARSLDDVLVARLARRVAILKLERNLALIVAAGTVVLWILASRL